MATLEDLADAQARSLIAALRSLRDDTPSNNLARASILGALAKHNPELYALALAEIEDQP